MGQNRLRRASETEEQDLFWALRGGGGNFGVVTSFEFRAHQHGPRVLCGVVVHSMAQARNVIQLYREITATAPDELCCLLILRRAPAAPYLPEEAYGKPIAAFAICWAGDPAGGAKAVLPFKALGLPLADTIAPKPFIEHQTMLDASQPFGRRYYWKSSYFSEIGERLVGALVDGAERITSPYSSVLLMHLGGAPARIDPTVNAVGLRTASHILNIQAAWERPPEDQRHIAWADAFWAAVRPFSTGGSYINFMTEDEDQSRVRAAYGDKVYTRLREIKARYDPSNLFRGAKNIPP
jgi:FAD/FMN-containing dehydrogenase